MIRDLVSRILPGRSQAENPHGQSNPTSRLDPIREEEATTPSSPLPCAPPWSSTDSDGPTASVTRRHAFSSLIKDEVHPVPSERPPALSGFKRS